MSIAATFLGAVREARVPRIVNARACAAAIINSRASLALP